MGFSRSLIFGPAPLNRLDRVRSYIEMERDFTAFDDIADYVTVGDGSEVLTLDTAFGGWLLVAPIAATDNTDNYAITPTSFNFAATKPAYFGASVKLTEAATSAANIVVGLSSIGTADFLTDNGGGPAASYDGALFFKVDGTMNWQTETSHTVTQQTTAAALAFASAQTYELGIYWDGSASIFFYIDQALVATHTTAGALPTANMGIVFGTKNGSANIETLKIDWFTIQACRAAIGSGPDN